MEEVYISKKQAEKAFQKYHDADVERFGVEIPDCFDAQLAIEIMNEIPVAVVREVVLCRDCMFAPIGEHDGADLEWPCNEWPNRNPCPCKCEDNWHSHKPAPDFYCAIGKKKDNQ